jgi:hypothetical protein
MNCRVLTVAVTLGAFGPVMATAAFGQDYWPLQVGNRWVYSHTRGRTDVYGNEQLVAQDVYVLEATGEETVAGHAYVRLSNGQRLGAGDDGSVLEFNDRFTSLPPDEMLVFDFASPPNSSDGGYTFRLPYAAFPPTIGGDPLAPDHWTSLAYRDVYDEPLSTAVGPFVDAVLFAYGNGIGDCAHYISFARGVGPVASTCMDHLRVFERYSLTGTLVGGRAFTPSTAVRGEGWGPLKRAAERR